MNRKLSDEEVVEKIWGRYEKGDKVTDIAKNLNVSRKTVSKHIASCPSKKALDEKRKKISFEKRKIYKKECKKAASLDAAYLKRQHDIDARVLSSERFFN